MYPQITQIVSKERGTVKSANLRNLRIK